MKSKSRLNEVSFRSVCRPVSSGVPELVVYTMLYVPSMVKDDDAETIRRQSREASHP